MLAAIRLSLEPRTRWSTSTPTRRCGPGLKSRRWSARSSTPPRYSTTTPSMRRSSPQTFSTSSASWRPSTKIRLARATRALAPWTATEPLAVRVGLTGPPLRGGRDEDDRPALEQEAGSERERTPLAAAVLQRQGVEVAVDGDDLAAPVGGDLLDDQAEVGRGLGGAAVLGGAPVGGEDVGAVAVCGGRHRTTLGRPCGGVGVPRRRRPRLGPGSSSQPQMPAPWAPSPLTDSGSVSSSPSRPRRCWASRPRTRRCRWCRPACPACRARRRPWWPRRRGRGARRAGCPRRAGGPRGAARRRRPRAAGRRGTAVPPSWSASASLVVALAWGRSLDSVMRRSYASAGLRVNPPTEGSDERQPLLAAGQVLVAEPHGRGEQLPGPRATRPPRAPGRRGRHGSRGRGWSRR